MQAASDYFGVRISLITSFRDTCFIEITPVVQKSKREIYLSFWAEVHYNSIYSVGDLQTIQQRTKKCAASGGKSPSTKLHYKEEKPSKVSKPKKRIKTSGKVCKKDSPRYKLIRPCQSKKQIRRATMPSQHLGTSHTLKRCRIQTRRKAYKTSWKSKICHQETCRQPSAISANRNDAQEGEEPDILSMNFSEPTFVPRKTSNKTPVGLKALLLRIFGFEAKKRPSHGSRW